ncbi:MAG: hypothetical protein AAFY82_00115 [Pseudomonadota bacterium]
MSDQFESLSWGSLPGSGDGELARVDMGSSTSIIGVDLIDVNLSGGDLADALAVEHSADGSAWTSFGSVRLGAQVQTLRVVTAPGSQVSARYVRIRQVDPSASSGRSLSISALKVLCEGETGGARIEPFTFDDDATYVVVVSAYNGEVYEGDARRASLSLPYTEGTIARLDFAQELDTMLIFHEEFAPFRVFRLGTDADWDTREQSFETMRQAEFDGTVYTNGVDEVQQLEFFNCADGDTFNITLDGDTTGSIVFSSTEATLAASIKSALEALPVMSGATITVTSTATDTFRITFGGEAADTNWPELAPSVINSTNGAIASATLTQGEPGGEDIMSSTRGWPRCGIFSDDRLWMLGLRDLPATGIVSKLGQYFEFEETNLRATDAIEFSIKTGDANGIRRIFEGDTLVAFTAKGAHYLTTEAVSAAEALAWRKAGDIGIQINIPPASIDGEVVYVQKGGKGLRALRYNGDTKRYEPSSAAVRAPELVDRPTAMFSRDTGIDDEDEMLALVNRDGRLSVYTSLKEQDIAAWSRWSIDGGIIAAGADSLAQVYFLTERQINGAAANYIERVDPSRLLDCSIFVTLDNSAAISGLDHLEGSQVYAVGLGQWWGPLTVSSGAVTLPDAVTGTLEVGLYFEAYVESMDPRFEIGGGSIIDKRKRIVDAVVTVTESLLPAAEYLGKTYPFLDRRKLASKFDRGPLTEPLYSGPARIEGFKGWARRTPIKIKRNGPGPLHITGLKIGVQI